MKKKSHLVVSALALAALVSLVTLVARTGYGQPQSSGQAVASTGTTAAGEARAATPAEAVTPKAEGPAAASEAAAGASLFASAAARNTVLKYELNWAFGGKQQRGWYLYTPLISRTLSADGDAATDGFASALSR